MKVTGISAIPAGGKDAVRRILGNGFLPKVKAAVLESERAKRMRARRCVIKSAEICRLQYIEGDPVGVFKVTVNRCAKIGSANRDVYKVYIVGGGRSTIDAAYFEKTIPALVC